VLDTLAEIQERNRAVKDLEASLLELHQVFLDMAVLVEAQGEMLDNIEKQVRPADPGFCCFAQSRAVMAAGAATAQIVGRGAGKRCAKSECLKEQAAGAWVMRSECRSSQCKALLASC
jgi:hypothetical protein